MEKESQKNILDRFKFTLLAREKLIEREDTEIERIISFANTLMGTIGIIAGFGFTAFDYIQTLNFFLFGEFLMVISIFYLGFKVKYHLVNTAISTSNSIYDFQDDAAKIKEIILNNDEESMNKKNKEFSDSINNSEIKPRIIRATPINSILNTTFFLSIIGLLFILISFTNLCQNF